MEISHIMMISLVAFIIGAAFIKLGIARGPQSWISGLLGYSIATVSATLLVNQFVITLGADNSNDVFIASIIIGAFIVWITSKLSFK